MNLEIVNKLWERTELKDGHWLWTGALANGKDQGVIRLNEETYSVSRLALSIYLKLPYKGNWAACHIDSLCRFPNCWNPLHLYQGSASSNTIDSIKLGTHYQVNKTHCKNGHEYTLENTIIVKRSNGRIERQCRICAKIAKEKQRIKLYAKSK